jgi:branched-chain amino acid transport system substrate-binding protein
VAAAVALLVLGTACTSSKEKKDTPTLKGEVQIGVLVPRGGHADLPERAADLADGAQLAADEINAHGGILGQRVVLTVLDDGCLPTTAYEAAKSLASSGVIAVVGGVCDEATAKEIAVIEASEIPFLVTSANAKDLVSRDSTSAYLMNGTLYQQALSSVYWMGYRSAQQLAVVTDTSADSHALADDAIRLVDQSPELVAKVEVPDSGADFAAIARSVTAGKPDFVLWTGSSPAVGGALLKALRSAGYTGTFTGTAASESKDFIQAAGAAADAAFVTATPTPANIPVAKEWNARFREVFGHDPGFDALQAYDAVRAIAHAAHSAQTTTGPELTTAVTRLDEDFTTFLGTLRFARDHTLLYDNRLILVVKDGGFTLERSLRTDF